MVYLFLANGFEEIEALATLDILRRANIDIKTVGVGSQNITGAHGICVKSDVSEDDIDFNNITAIILPGGMPGTTNLQAHAGLCSLLKEKHAQGVMLAAICAAPMAFAQLGLLNGEKATIYPAMKDELENAIYSENMVVKSRNNICIFCLSIHIRQRVISFMCYGYNF